MRRVLLLCCVCVVAGCGSSNTTAPSDPTLRDGNYQLEFIGYETPMVNGSPVTSCAGLGQMGIETLATHVTMKRTGDSWTGQPLSAADGSFDLQLQRTGATTGSYTATVTGSIGGTVNNTITLVNFGFIATSLTLPSGPRVSLTGFVGSQLAAGTGTVTGDVLFTNPDGSTLRCAPGVQWTLVGPQ